MRRNRILSLLFILLLSLSLFGCSVIIEGDIFGASESSSANLGKLSGELQVIFLDIGQGDSVLLISPNGKTMLVDAGDNDKKQVMLDYMKEYDIKQLDVVVATHPHADHIGGMNRVIDHLEVGKVYMPKITHTTKTYENLLLSIKNKGLKVSTAKAGVIVDWDEHVKVNMIAPVQEYKDLNNMSAVLKVTYGDVSFILTGDAEADSEMDMLQSRADLSATVLGVGHHGSHTSTTAEFLKAVNPTYAVIQSGEGNSYGHPHKVTLDRLEKQGVKVYRNDLQGTVKISTDGKNVNINTER